MKFAIITHVVHQLKDGNFFAYGPYVREMDLWNQYASQVLIAAPLSVQRENPINLSYAHRNVDFTKVPLFDLLTVKGCARSLFLLPLIFWKVFRVMQKADHIHLRCPGNVGLVGCVVQMLFPGKTKTAKYAGNWDPKSKQPWSYRLQCWLLSNTFLTRNMQVLVYGDWPNSTANIKPFFTASYREADKVSTPPRRFENGVRFVFVGTLSPGKRPLYAISLVENLKRMGHNVTLDVYGEGVERDTLAQYIAKNNLESFVKLQGNQSAIAVKDAYQSAHFLLLPSRSEGWPKVVAEAMFWGCLPISTPVSCVPFMLDGGNRGLILDMTLEHDALAVESLLQNQGSYDAKVAAAMTWSREYTLDKFEESIQKLLEG
ncbi:glycosyltransferase family 4 protein [Flavobacterium caeni]|uniref:Glycosyltransferase involved in cell wall bisynthesis n=1 Tax=Flavobacterium caeni TaxID=490189 RepID=A0A1G5FLR9_9FLAO|nr:glycosyltransferase [Flavobacterium caeni]SCY40094.1 Glycosyltransferase involved in cell wall bisynthesis [Flavobacterium caeni]